MGRRSTELQRQVDDLVARGWRIEDESADRVTMVKHEFGSLGSHLVVALLTLWWTMGLGNLAWGLYKYATASKRRVLWEDDYRDGIECPDCGATVPADASYCRSCGAEVGGVRPSSAGEPLTCPECEAVVGEGSRYCPSCGTNLADALGPSESRSPTI